VLVALRALCGFVGIAVLFTSAPAAQQQAMMIRIAEIQVHPEALDDYKRILTEEAEASVRLEPGVVAIFPMFQRDAPTEVRILEIYASQAAYQAHLETPHFKHYKSATLQMVKSLKLVDMTTSDAAAISAIFKKAERR
jgi:quinol monooxygenase YgiN